jgi:arabinofuranosyltransferase
MTATTDAAEDHTSADGPARRAAATVRAWLWVLPAVMIGIGGWLHRWTDEDAFINFRIVDQVFAGHGPVFNAGERIETYTSTLWLAVLVVGKATLGFFMGLEWISVLFGLAAAIAAFLIAARAGRHLFGGEVAVAPVGLIVVAAIPVVWDFATSGLEMSLVWLWIAGSWLALTRVVAAPTPGPRARRWSLVTIGLGPLVRPELGLMMLIFLVAWFVLVRPRRIGRDLVIAWAIPVAYQIFRMGFFASLVPSTALAKDSGGLHLGQGWAYFRDLVGTYALWIPGLALLALVVWMLRDRRDRRVTVAVTAMLVAAAASAGYMVFTGGDYMHGRLLLPAVFAFGVPATLPLRAVAAPRRAVLRLGAVAVAGIWAVVVIAGVRYPQPKETFGLTDIADWRLVLHKQMFHRPGPGITISPYELRRNYDDGWRGFMRILDTEPRAGRDPRRLAVMMGSIGVPAWVAGVDIFVIDIGGLAEPLAARTDPIPNRPAGHRKQVDDQWYDARFGVGGDTPRIRAARRALGCQPIKGLIAAVDDPLTPGRFVSNLWHAAPYTFMKIPKNPIDAERKFC